MADRKKPKCWSHSVGDKPNRVTVFERRPGGLLYLRAWDPTMGVRGGWRKRSLKHRDKEAAKTAAAREHAKLCEGDQAIREGRVTLKRLFSLYELHRTPHESEKEQKEDKRRLTMWTRVLGASRDPHRISRHAWETFIEDRLSGAIDPAGAPVEGARRRVGPRAVERDLRFLCAVLNWGTT